MTEKMPDEMAEILGYTPDKNLKKQLKRLQDYVDGKPCPYRNAKSSILYAKRAIEEAKSEDIDTSEDERVFSELETQALEKDRQKK